MSSYRNMKTKTCKWCKIDKPISEYNKYREFGLYKSICKTCLSAYQKGRKSTDEKIKTNKKDIRYCQGCGDESKDMFVVCVKCLPKK